MRVIDQEGEQVGIVTIEEANGIASEASLDLVEISPNAEPPVCRIMDYGKFRFEESKKLQTAKKKQKQTQVKEIKFRPGTDIGDYNIKLRKLISFLEDGDRTKVTLRFRGREMAHQNLGVGRKLLDEAIRWFKASDASNFCLESNSKLAPAIRLYESMGFAHAEPDEPSSYERTNVYMAYQP